VEASAYWVKVLTALLALSGVMVLAAAAVAVQAAKPPPMAIPHPAPEAAHMEVAAVAVGITPKT
jgi:hypothetical protein